MTRPLDALAFRSATADDAAPLASVLVEGFETYMAFAPAGWRPPAVEAWPGSWRRSSPAPPPGACWPRRIRASPATSPSFQQRSPAVRLRTRDWPLHGEPHVDEELDLAIVEYRRNLT